jgi:hypothetical protein
VLETWKKSMKSKLQNVLCLTEERKKYAVVDDDVFVVVVAGIELQQVHAYVHAKGYLLEWSNCPMIVELNPNQFVPQPPDQQLPIHSWISQICIINQ